MIRTQLYLDEAIHRRLQALVRRQGRTLSELVREALRGHTGSLAPTRETSLRAIEGLWTVSGGRSARPLAELHD